MGLAEKRMLAQVRDEVAPKYQKELREIAGEGISFDIDWASFGESMEAMGNLENKALKPLCEIFRKITVDQIGKDAVAEGIQTIRVSHQDDSSNTSAFTLINGVLSIPWDWEGWAGSFYPDSVQEKIESML